jgi:hypothetical protein
MQQANPAGTATVLEAARRQGLDPIVYVSTIGVFLPVTGPALTAGTPVGAGFGPYSRSKIAAETGNQPPVDPLVSPSRCPRSPHGAGAGVSSARG